ncbi:MAG: biotin--[acetyl-CoA-carboxylase] ligase [Flavobacteriales bacterium]|nr:biotin--[acetyl-CoA-carboxylase] ligase [Flavobacteriales bacterium]
MNTLFFGQHIINLDEVDSTNNYTSEFIRHNVMQEGLLVRAKSQISGKGQRGNNWESDPNENLTFSIYVKPSFISIDEQFVLNKWVSLSILSVLRIHGIEAEVKWPNDIFVGNKKTGGILIENSVSTGINHSIVGIGLNVNQMVFKGLPNATSMKQQVHKMFNLNSVLEQLCIALEQNYLQPKADKSILNEAYINHLYQFNQEVKYRDNKGIFIGKIVGISTTGQLQIKAHDKIRSYGFKEVEFLDQ